VYHYQKKESQNKKKTKQNKTITKITLPLPIIEKNNNKAVK